MKQKQLEASIRLSLITQLARHGVSFPVIAGFQPTKQGRVKDGIYFFPLNIGKRGWQSRKYVDPADDIVQSETQINESMYQFQAFVQDDVQDSNQLLAADVLAIVRGSLQSLPFVEAMTAAGIGVQRPTDIVNPSFVNEQDQFEFNPNFTIIFTHRRTIEMTTPHVAGTQFDIHRI